MEYGHILLFDTGCFFPQTPDRDADRKIRIMVTAMNQMEYSAAGLGRSDFFLGTAYLSKIISDLSFPIVVSNLDDPKGRLPGYHKYHIIETGGKTVAVLGIMPVDALANLDGLEGVSDLIVQPAAPVVKALVTQLKPKVDMIILLSQFSAEETYHIIRYLNEIDFAIASDPKATLPGILPDHLSPSPIVYPASHGRAVGMAIAQPTPDGFDILPVDPIELGKNVPEDEETRAHVAEITKDAYDCGQKEQQGDALTTEELKDGLKMTPREFMEKMKRENKAI